MKFEQKPKFQPITITLETREESESLWTIIQQFPNLNNDKKIREVVNRISNWFSNEAQL